VAIVYGYTDALRANNQGRVHCEQTVWLSWAWASAHYLGEGGGRGECLGYTMSEQCGCGEAGTHAAAQPAAAWC